MGNMRQEKNSRRQGADIVPGKLEESTGPDGYKVADLRDERLLRLFQSDIIGIVLAGIDGQIIDANDYFLRLVGYSREELAAGAVNWEEMTPAEYRHLDQEGVENLFATGSCPAFRKEYLRSDGSRVPVLIGGALWDMSPGSDTPDWVCFVLDDTERKQAEEEAARYREHLESLAQDRSQQLAEAESNLGQIVRSSADGMVVIGLDGAVLFANPAAQELFGKDVTDQMLGFPVVAGSAEVELPRGEDSERIIAEMRVVEVQWGGEQAHLATFRDVTKRKVVEGRLRSLSERLIEIQEEERRRIGRELHDQLGQSLNFVKLSVERALKAEKPDIHSILGDSPAVLADLLESVRNLSLDLRPTILDDLGLLETLKTFFKRYTAQTGVRVDFRHNFTEAMLGSRVSTAAYRIVQEAAGNAARHAGVNRVSVSLRMDKGNLCVRVSDRGTGFASSMTHAAGLSGMEERARLVGGKFTVRSSPGAGTTVLARLPLDR